MKMKYTRLRKLMIITLFIGATSVNAQKAETPTQTYDLGSSINEMSLTVGGVLVVATNEGLVGIRPTENTPIFTFNNFGKLKPEETDFVPNSP